MEFFFIIFLRLGRYSLASRSLMELQPYLKSTYPDDLLECTICTEVCYLYPIFILSTHEVLQVLTRGVACYAPNCKVRIHAHCLATFRRSKTGTACPSCSKAWPKDKLLTPVGEEAAREGDDRKRRVRVDFADDNEEEDATEDHPPNSPPAGRKGGRLHRRKANAQDNSMEVDDENDEQDEVPPVQSQAQGAQRTRRSTRH